MEKRFTILLPTRPQPDTLVAIFLLKTFGKEKFAGVAEAQVEVRHQLKDGETFESLLAQNILAMDVGGGPLDHHGKNECTSELVARHLGIEKDPALQAMLSYARRDDKEGKGTISKDSIDRAFGLSGLVGSLNKMYTSDPQKIVDAVMPLLAAQYHSAREHHVELPHEVAEKSASGQFEKTDVRQENRTLSIAFVVSDKPSMPSYLRSVAGGHFDVVVQKSEKENHYCILSRQERKVDLSKVAALIRLREGELRGKDLGNDAEDLGKNTRHDEVPMWYVDPATNSILNGGPHNRGVEESKIPWDEMKKIVALGLEMGK